jgi:hypothetical protein
MLKYSRAALFLLLALFLSCDSPTVVPTMPLVRLRLNNLPPDATAVTVKITIGDTTRTVDFVANGSDPLDVLTVSFPDGATGEVTISIDARDAAGCLIGSGSGRITLTNNDVRELPIGMTQPMLACGTPAAKIIVQITNTGTAMGKVTSQPAGIDCGNSCDAVFMAGNGTPGTGMSVVLTAQATTGLFLGWSGACSGTDTCTLPLDAVGEYIVRAAFGTPQPCATGWCEEPSGTTSDLYGIWGISPLNIVAVGAGGTIVKWDGQSWTPQTSGVTATLRAVSVPRGTTKFIAVGAGGTILTEDMDTWTKRTDPTGGKTLYGVAGVSNAETFIVGETGTLLKGDAAAGTFTVRPPNGGTNNPPASVATKVLRAIAASPNNNNLLFVGDMATNLRRHTFFGADLFDDPGTGLTQNLHGVFFFTDRIFTVGAAGTLARRGPPAFGDWPEWVVEATPPVTSDLNGVWAAANNQAFAVGQAGVILQFDGTSWTRRTSNTTKNLYAIWGAGSTNIYAVGEGGVIMHYLP